jgi:mono/diheme cytochrome c family protein
MRLRRLKTSMHFTAFIILCLGLLGADQGNANPVFSDEYSRSRGALLYDMYCSECHGAEAIDATAELFDADLGTVSPEQLLPDAEALATENVEDDDWPEWAERPYPGTNIEPDIREEARSAVLAGFEEADASEQQGDGDGANSEVITFVPRAGGTNLAHPQTYFYGTTEEELFNSIANGTGVAMPGWSAELGSEEAIWDVVNYIRSSWSEYWLY